MLDQQRQSKEGRGWVQKAALQVPEIPLKHFTTGEEWLKVKNVQFRYHKKSDFILKELDLSLNKGEFYALLGGNGSGKSTLLKVIAGLLKPENGKILYENKLLKNSKRTKKIGYLPQNPKLFFIQDTVGGEIQATLEQWGISDNDILVQLLSDLGIDHLLESHPFDLSGGELQKAALACLLLQKPEILLLDEPTKGLDPISKAKLAKILSGLHEAGNTIFMSTHDIEFAAQYATKCGMMFQGKITAEGTPGTFFKGNFFYTTMVQRIFRDSLVKELSSNAF